MGAHGNRVIVFGGGVAGFTAAHELLERGFSVDLIEQRTIAGGRARSYPVARNARGRFVSDSARRLPGLHFPGEHGFRFFSGFYRHLFDTLKRIPLPSEGTVFDNLVELEEGVLGLADGRRVRPSRLGPANDSDTSSNCWGSSVSCCRAGSPPMT